MAFFGQSKLKPISPTKKMDFWVSEGSGGPILGPIWWVRYALGYAYNAELWRFLAKISENTSPPLKKWVSGGQGGHGGRILSVFSHIFDAIFLKLVWQKSSENTKV